MNRLPSAVDCEEEAGVSSPNSTISSVSGKRSERETNEEDRDTDRACYRGISDEEDAETSRKKLRLSKDQSAVLEESFKEHNTLNPVSIPFKKPSHLESWLVAQKIKQTDFLGNQTDKYVEYTGHVGLFSYQCLVACLAEAKVGTG